MKNRHIIERLTGNGDLTAELVTGQPLVELLGDRRVLVENHRGIAEYGHERIKINLDFGVLCITGCVLTIAYMSKQRLIIRGTIMGISIHRR